MNRDGWQVESYPCRSKFREVTMDQGDNSHLGNSVVCFEKLQQSNASLVQTLSQDYSNTVAQTIALCQQSMAATTAKNVQAIKQSIAETATTMTKHHAENFKGVLGSVDRIHHNSVDTRSTRVNFELEQEELEASERVAIDNFTESTRVEGESDIESAVANAMLLYDMYTKDCRAVQSTKTMHRSQLLQRLQDMQQSMKKSHPRNTSSNEAVEAGVGIFKKNFAHHKETLSDDMYTEMQQLNLSWEFGETKALAELKRRSSRNDLHNEICALKNEIRTQVMLAANGVEDSVVYRNFSCMTYQDWSQFLCLSRVILLIYIDMDDKFLFVSLGVKTHPESSPTMLGCRVIKRGFKLLIKRIRNVIEDDLNQNGYDLSVLRLRTQESAIFDCNIAVGLKTYGREREIHEIRQIVVEHPTMGSCFVDVAIIEELLHQPVAEICTEIEALCTQINLHVSQITEVKIKRTELNFKSLVDAAQATIGALRELKFDNCDVAEMNCADRFRIHILEKLRKTTTRGYIFDPPFF